jgi:hypothetical protein
VYSIFIYAEWVPCVDSSSPGAVCVNSSSGKDVLEALGVIFPVIDSNNTNGFDIGIMIAIAMFWKILSIIFILIKSSRVALIEDKIVVHKNRSQPIKVPRKMILDDQPIGNPKDIENDENTYEYGA